MRSLSLNNLFCLLLESASKLVVVAASLEDKKISKVLSKEDCVRAVGNVRGYVELKNGLFRVKLHTVDGNVVLRLKHSYEGLTLLINVGRKVGKEATESRVARKDVRGDTLAMGVKGNVLGDHGVTQTCRHGSYELTVFSVGGKCDWRRVVFRVKNATSVKHGSVTTASQNRELLKAKAGAPDRVDLTISIGLKSPVKKLLRSLYFPWENTKSKPGKPIEWFLSRSMCHPICQLSGHRITYICLHIEVARKMM